MRVRHWVYVEHIAQRFDVVPLMYQRGLILHSVRHLKFSDLHDLERTLWFQWKCKTRAVQRSTEHDRCPILRPFEILLPPKLILHNLMHVRIANERIVAIEKIS